MWECATLAAKIHSKPSAGYNKATAKVKAGGGVSSKRDAHNVRNACKKVRSKRDKRQNT